MPELPEVETIVRALRNPIDLPLNVQKGQGFQPGIIGRVISKGLILWERSLAVPSTAEFLKRITNQQITAVKRRGKYIIIEFPQQCLLIHLRMSGSLIVEQEKEIRNDKHDRMRLDFTDGASLIFNDPRKFGRIWLVNDPEQVTGSLGLEPFSDDLNSNSFYQKLQSTKRKIKPLLLDQTFLAGLGNIYTDEALFSAGIHPNLPSNLLKPEEAARLLQSIREVLQDGIQSNGASIDWVYQGGGFQNHFLVYQRGGELCSKCGTKIERIVVGQRGTHFCPNCQRLRTNQ